MPLYDRLWLATIWSVGLGLSLPVYFAYLPYHMLAYRFMPEVYEEMERMSDAIMEKYSGQDVS